MRKVVTGLALVLGVALLTLVGGPAAAQKKKASETDATDQDYAILAKMTEVNGVIKSFDGVTGLLTLKVDAPNAESKVNPNSLNAAQQAVLRELNDIRRREQALATTKNPATRQRLMAELQRDFVQLQQKMDKLGLTAQGTVKVTMAYKDFDIQGVEDFKIRLAKLPVEYDDKGNVKTLTAKEQEERKGTGKDRTLPGYEGTLQDLTVGSKVKVYLAKKPAAKKEGTKGTEEGKKESTEPTPPQARAYFRMILIEEVAVPPAFTPKKGM